MALARSQKPVDLEQFSFHFPWCLKQRPVHRYLWTGAAPPCWPAPCLPPSPVQGQEPGSRFRAAPPLSETRIPKPWLRNHKCHSEASDTCVRVTRWNVCVLQLQNCL